MIDSVRKDRWRWTVFAVAVCGLGIRVAFIWFGSRRDGPVGDQLFYSAQAIANARGDWFEQPFVSGVPAADHPPLTALVITPVTWMFTWTGSVVTVQRLQMAIIGTVSVFAMAYLGRLVGGIRAGLLAAGATAVYVNVWVNDGLVMAETLTFLLVTLITISVLRSIAEPSPGRFACIGFLCASAALTRAELVILVPLIALLATFELRRRDRAGTVVNVVALIAVFCAVVSPWVIWNQIRFDGPAFLSTNDGLTLAGANCDRTYFEDIGGWDLWCAYEVPVPDDADPAEASAIMRKAGLDYWRQNLDQYPKVAVARLARVFSFGYLGSSAHSATAEGRPIWLTHIGNLQYWSMIPLAMVGFRRRTTSSDRFVLLGTVPLVVVVGLVANAYVRFRVPSEVGLVVLASLGADFLWTSARRTLSVRRPISA